MSAGRLNIEEIKFFIEEFHLSRAMPNLHLDIHYEPILKAHVMAMTRQLGRISGPEMRFPKTWWDHFKKRWFPAWAHKRWPVEYTVVRPNEFFAFNFEISQASSAGKALSIFREQAGRNWWETKLDQ